MELAIRADAYDESGSSVTELNLDRDNVLIPEEISELNRRNFVVGIGGHHARPNVRLFSYALPAIDLARQCSGPSRLTLATSLNGALRYNYASEEKIGIQNAVNYNTEEKLALIKIFIEEFFPSVFESVNNYYGDIQNNISDETWVAIWEEIKRRDPISCRRFIDGIKRPESPETIAYAVRHSFWFLDHSIDGDKEFERDIASTNISVGSEKEALFNLIRRSIAALPLDLLQEILQVGVKRGDKIFQLIFPTGTPVPYGESLKGKANKQTSAEIEIGNRQDISSSYPWLIADVHYTIRRLRECGFEDGSFQEFLNNL